MRSVLRCIKERDRACERDCNDVDSSAFVIVSDVREVLGEGFLEYSDDFRTILLKFYSEILLTGKSGKRGNA